MALRIHHPLAEETIAKGREIAKLRPPVLVLLKGDLGSGKTTLTKGIISGLGAAREEDVTSPTFNLVHEFGSAAAADSPPNIDRCKVYHVDLYRVENFPDLESIGLEDALPKKRSSLSNGPSISHSAPTGLRLKSASITPVETSRSNLASAVPPTSERRRFTEIYHVNARLLLTGWLPRLVPP